MTCYLNGNVFSSNNNSLSHLNNVNFCALNSIVPSATPSNLTVKVSGTTGNPFLFDRIQYEWDASAILDDATVVVDAYDSKIGYSGWSTLDGVALGTSVQGFYLIFDFIGAFRL